MAVVIMTPTKENVGDKLFRIRKTTLRGIGVDEWVIKPWMFPQETNV